MSESKHVLVVDDSEETVLFLTEILEANGFQYRVAGNGKEALGALNESRPDLVLLDVMMPRKNGLGVFRDMKRDPNLAAIPVIFVTGASEVTGVDLSTGVAQPKEVETDDFARNFGTKLHDIFEELRTEGMAPDDLVEKPIEPAVLIEKIRAILN